MIREPQTIMSYAMLSIVAISCLQKDVGTNICVPAFDYYMEKGVLKTFKKEFRSTIYDVLEYSDFDKFIALNGIEREIEKIQSIDFDIKTFYKYTRNSAQIKRMFDICYKKALNKTDNQVYQSMEAFVHDLNSICKGNIITINLGTDESAEGRMVIKNLLKTIEEGLGEKEKIKSPIIVFKIKKNINFSKKSKNYDLLKMACKIASETDNITFSFLDTNFNSFYYKEGDYNTEVAYFYDGTRIIDNIFDDTRKVSDSRGILGTVVINLTRIALNSEKSLNRFYDELYQKMDLAKDELLERFDIQSNKKPKNFPFLIGQNIWIDSDRLKDDDKLRKCIKHGIMNISFIGLDETSRLLDEKNNLKIKKEIIQNMSKRINEYSKKYNLNFELGCEYNKNISENFWDLDRVIYGKIPEITDKKGYYSIGISQEENIDKKIEEEKDFQEYINSELICNLNVKHNIKEGEILEVLQKLNKNEIGYVKFIKNL